MERNGETPPANSVSSRFTDGIFDAEMCIFFTHSGAMSQDTFYHFALHFLKSLPEEGHYQSSFSLMAMDHEESQSLS
jgi:hypothetical protein